MKLYFDKNANEDIEVAVLNGANKSSFSYISMIKSLLGGETLESEFAQTVDGDEQQRIKGILKEIENAVNPPILQV